MGGDSAHNRRAPAMAADTAFIVSEGRQRVWGQSRKVPSDCFHF